MSIKKQAGTSLKNERGVILAVSVLMLAVLVALGTMATMQTSTDLKITSNYRTGERAFYAAEAGIEEARARLRKNTASSINDGHPDSNEWRAYIGNDAKAKNKGWDDTNAMHVKASSFQSDLEYVVKIVHQTDVSGNVLYWGDTDGDGISERNTISGQSIYLVTSYGYSGSSIKVVETEMRRPAPVTVKSALYAKSGVSIIGIDACIDGNDCGGEAPAKPPVYTKTPFETDPPTNPKKKVEIFLPVDPVQGPEDIDIEGCVESLKSSSTETITADQTAAGTSYGSDTCFVTCYSDTSDPVNVDGLKLSNVTGYGILLVKGDLTLAENFNWNGLILVTGTLAFDCGEGCINIEGAVLANQTVTLNGNVGIRYSSCAIENSIDGLPLIITNWRESYSH